jgi:hypothetical protein
MNDINRVFNPKRIVIESQSDPSIQGIIRDRANEAKIAKHEYSMFRNNTLVEYFSMLYSWKRSRDLLLDYENEQQMKFDIVIKLRTDLLFKSPYDVKRGLGKVCVPFVGNCYRGAMNDMFAVGGHDQMITYLSLFDSVVGYLNRRETTFRPEWFIRHHLVKNGVLVSEDQINYGIVRCNGNFQSIGRAN